jgi:hypothetical protein
LEIADFFDREEQFDEASHEQDAELYSAERNDSPPEVFQSRLPGSAGDQASKPLPSG